MKRGDDNALERERVPAFRQCSGCTFDFITGEGHRACGWFECPYLPEALDVFCPGCNYNFALDDGGASCGDPPTCEWAGAGYRHAGNARRRLGRSIA